MYRNFVFLLLLAHRGVALMLLSDIPTPALVIDTDPIWKTADLFQLALRIEKDESTRRPARVLYAAPVEFKPIGEDEDRDGSRVTSKSMCFTAFDNILFWHSSVLRGREQKMPDKAPFLAELDLGSAVKTRNFDPLDLQLVLGWNNHHVGSYYWARSAGAGAAMEAPGVDLVDGRYLTWSTRPEDQTNDGKRSEWVNFLKPGDQVQLLPKQHPEACLLDWLDQNEFVYGISSRDRPKGSEPQVVCQWKC